MNKLLLGLMVVVYLNNGNIYKYPEAKSVWDNSEPGGLFDGGHVATLIHISKCPYRCKNYSDLDVAVFPINSVEKYEFEKDDDN